MRLIFIALVLTVTTNVSFGQDSSFTPTVGFMPDSTYTNGAVIRAQEYFFFSLPAPDGSWHIVYYPKKQKMASYSVLVKKGDAILVEQIDVIGEKIPEQILAFTKTESAIGAEVRFFNIVAVVNQKERVTLSKGNSIFLK